MHKEDPGLSEHLVVQGKQNHSEAAAINTQVNTRKPESELRTTQLPSRSSNSYFISVGAS